MNLQVYRYILRTVPTNGKYFFPDNEYVRPREDKGDREGIPHTHPIPQVIRLELFLESG